MSVHEEIGYIVQDKQTTDKILALGQVVTPRTLAETIPQSDNESPGEGFALYRKVRAQIRSAKIKIRQDEDVIRIVSEEQRVE